MITHLHLKSSPSSGAASLSFETGPSVTIFVGPNNAGKSQVLREINSFCHNGNNQATVILEKLVFSALDSQSAKARYEEFYDAPKPGEHLNMGHSYLKFISDRIQIRPGEFMQALEQPNNSLNLFTQWYLRFFVLNLDGANRINLLSPQGMGDLKNPSNPFSRLLTDDERRKELREIVHEAFGFYSALDPTQGGQLQMRFGQTQPPNERREIYTDEVINYMKDAKDIQNVSDGVKAFTGILVQLYAGEPEIILVDEPEAFLHPALASKLGKELANGAAEQRKSVFISTHSPQIIMGAVSSGAKVNIVRLTYENGKGTARLLPNSDLTKLMQDPLLRSVGVLSGLFYKNVIVCEADADRAFYQECNERLLAQGDERGIQDALFLNANGKDTTSRIIEPLRRLGIPAVEILDIDIIKNGGDTWTRHLSACHIPVPEHQPYGTRRNNLLAALQRSEKNFKIEGGINLLKDADLETANNLFEELQKYGLFIVPVGEVEAWLQNIKVSRSKRGENGWLNTIFEVMGNDPSSPTYVRPSEGDVWDFIGKMKTWFTNPQRRGIPS